MPEYIEREAAVAVVRREHEYDNDISIPGLLRRLEMYLNEVPAAPVDELVKAARAAEASLAAVLPLVRAPILGDCGCDDSVGYVCEAHRTQDGVETAHKTLHAALTALGGGEQAAMILRADPATTSDLVASAEWRSEDALPQPADPPIGVSIDSDGVEFTILRPMHGFKLGLEQLQKLVAAVDARQRAPEGGGKLVLMWGEDGGCYRLCYVKGPWAYFTTQALDKQQGDDWDDAPYEYNAGPPYEWREGDNRPRYGIKRVAFDGPFSQPCDKFNNSPWSVKDINNGEVPWLTSECKGHETLMAGATFEEFVAFVERNHGEVYQAKAGAPQ